MMPYKKIVLLSAPLTTPPLPESSEAEINEKEASEDDGDEDDGDNDDDEDDDDDDGKMTMCVGETCVTGITLGELKEKYMATCKDKCAKVPADAIVSIPEDTYLKVGGDGDEENVCGALPPIMIRGEVRMKLSQLSKVPDDLELVDETDEDDDDEDETMEKKEGEKPERKSFLNRYDQTPKHRIPDVFRVHHKRRHNKLNATLEK